MRFGGSSTLAVALGSEFEDGGMVDESVDCGHGHGLVGEDGIPIRKGTITGDDETAVFVAFGDELEEDAGFGVVLFCVER